MMARILIIDDEGIIRKKLKHLLELEGYEVLVAGDGKEGLEILQKEKPDIALVDIRMPGMDGIEVLKRIKERSRRTEVVIITGHCEVATILQAMRAGAFGYVQKTINYDQIEIEIKRALKKQEMQKKLDEYMHNLEEAVEEKERELKQREKVEKELHKQTHDLGERVKELNCLYSVSQLVEKSGISLEEILQGVVNLIPPSWQYPEITCARITLDNQVFKTNNFEETIWKQACDITVYGDRIGILEVFYFEERPEIDEGPFLKEERSLINSIAQALGMIIERTKGEDQTKQQSEFLNNTIEALSHPFYVIDANDYTIKMANSAADMGTLTANSTCYALTHKRNEPCDDAVHLCPLKKVKKLKKPVVVEHIHYDKNGNARNYEVHGFPVFNSEGIVVQMIEYSLDITERKMAVNELRKTKDYLDNIIESSIDSIVISDETGYVTKANKTFFELIGYKKEEVIGKHTMELTITEAGTYESTSGELYEIDKEFFDTAREKISQLHEEGKVLNWEGYYLDKNKKVIPVEHNAVLLYDEEGNMTGALGINRDITERKAMERKLLQAEKLKSLGELAGGVAHDFNNVLAAILGRAQLLKSLFEPLPGKEERRKSMIELKESLDVIEQASKDGAETVRRIQEFARQRTDDKYFTTVDLNEIINNALEYTKMRWKGDAESKGIRINIQKELSILPTTSGSAAELREVLTNLINNALDAMPQGGEIKIKTYREDGHITIKVEDKGIGIPKSLRGKIFDPFFTTKGVQSTGLGMSVSYGIIRSHRGTISVDSIEGRGTVFTINLPISEKIIEGEKVKRIEGESRKAKIMIIEDEEAVRDLLSKILKRGGHEVEVVSDGSQGIEMFEKKEFDLVFTDLGLPGMSGWQVAEKIKGINGRVPVVLITGWEIKERETETRDDWVDLIMHKPFEMDQVLNTVQEGMILRDRFKAV